MLVMQLEGVGVRRMLIMQRMLLMKITMEQIKMQKMGLKMEMVSESLAKGWFTLVIGSEASKECPIPV